MERLGGRRRCFAGSFGAVTLAAAGDVQQSANGGWGMLL